MANDKPFVGQMDRKIQVHKTTTVPDETSTPVPTKVLVASPWAMMKDVGGSQEVDGAVVSVVNRSYIIRRYAEIAKSGLTMTVTDGDVVFDIHAIKVIGRAYLELMVQYAGEVVVTDGGGDPGGGDPGGGGSCDGITNWTGVTISSGENFQTIFTLTGGSVKGQTEVVIEGYLTQTLDEGDNDFNAGLGLGTHTIRWRRICGGSPVTDWVGDQYEVINTGESTIRLSIYEPFNENNVQFPVKVARVVTPIGGLDQVTDSGQVANDENEFVEIWNQVNSDIGVISNPLFEIFPEIRYWGFTIMPNDYIQRPSAAWCYLVE